jgi:hypothetical protein
MTGWLLILTFMAPGINPWVQIRSVPDVPDVSACIDGARDVNLKPGELLVSIGCVQAEVLRTPAPKPRGKEET